MDITRSVSQHEIAGLLRPTIHTSGGVGSGHFGGGSPMKSHGSCAGDSAPDHEPSDTSGTSVLWALRLVGRACQSFFDVGFSGWEALRQGTIHFAGEHCSQDFQGYMEGGASTGLAAANEIVADLKRA